MLCVSRLEENKQTLELGALVQMATLGLVLIGAAIVLLESIFNPRQADPMGIFEFARPDKPSSTP